MIKLYNDHKDDLAIVGVTTYYGWYGDEHNNPPNMSRDIEFSRMQDDFMKKYELPWPTVFGDRNNFTNYGVSGIPHITVIDRDGKVVSYKIGYSPESFAEFRKEIEKLLKN